MTPNQPLSKLEDKELTRRLSKVLHGLANWGHQWNREGEKTYIYSDEPVSLVDATTQINQLIANAVIDELKKLNFDELGVLNSRIAHMIVKERIDKLKGEKV